MTDEVDILLVEDNKDHIYLTKKALEKFKEPVKLKVHVVSDGIQALDFVNKRPPYKQAPTPDLILLDIKLPNMSGFEVLASFKKDDKFCSIPIVMLSSSENQKDIINSYRLGSNSYITKPIKTDELFNKLKNIPLYWVETNTLPPKG